MLLGRCRWRLETEESKRGKKIKEKHGDNGQGSGHSERSVCSGTMLVVMTGGGNDEELVSFSQHPPSSQKTLVKHLPYQK